MNWFTAWIVGVVIALLLDIIIVGGLHIHNLIACLFIGILNGLVWPNLCIRLYGKDLFDD